jgi:copper chaperone CopZ
VDVTLLEVEQAGCESCAALVRAALEEVGTVLEVTVDENADLATVLLEALLMPPEGDIDRLLSAVPPEGHAYRIRPVSWRAALGLSRSVARAELSIHRLPCRHE